MLESAIVNTLKDPKVLSEFAKVVARKVLDEKSKPSNEEETLVKNHVIFATIEDEGAEYMTANEIMQKLTELLPNAQIRVRSLGKALLTDCLVNKQTNQGKAYLIKDIVKDLEEHASHIPVKETVEVKEKTSKETEKKKDKKKKKKDKNLELNFEPDVDSEKEQLPKVKPEDAFEAPEISSETVEEIANKYSSLDDLEDELDEMNRGELIKWINKFQLPIITGEDSAAKIVEKVVNLLESYSEYFESSTEAVAHKKKDKKKKTVEDIEKRLSEEDLTDLSEKQSKKDKKKKKKDKKKKKKKDKE